MSVSGVSRFWRKAVTINITNSNVTVLPARSGVSVYSCISERYRCAWTRIDSSSYIAITSNTQKIIQTIAIDIGKSANPIVSLASSEIIAKIDVK
jgi:hypothetical protein